MKKRLSMVGWVFLLMMGVAYFGYSFISLFHIQDVMLQNGLGTVLLGLPAVMYLVLQDKPNKEKVRFHLLSWKAVLLLLVIAVALELVTIEINIATSFVFSSYTTDSISTDVSSSSFLVSLICMAVLPAIFEELSFRGAFFQEYRDAYGAWAGALLSGFLFGLYHMNMRQFIYAFLCGVFFALLIEATDSIEASMILHFLMNTISCIAIYVSSSFSEESVQMAAEAQRQYLLGQLLSFFPISIVGLVLLIVCYIGLAKCCGRYNDIKAMFSWKNLSFQERIGSRQEEEGKAPWRWIFSIPFVVSVALCIYVIIVIEIQT
jgi:hypothetical protein